MTIDAVHATLEMNVVEMYGLAELCRIVKRNNISLCVQKVSFSISLINFAKHPAMAVEVGKLGVAQECVETGRTGVFQEIKVGPQATETRAFGIAIEFFLLFILTRVVLRRRLHLRAVALIVPPR